MENKILKTKIIPIFIIKHIEKDFGKIINISASDIALTNKVFFINTISKKIVLKIFGVKNKYLFNINNHKLLIDHFSKKNITPSFLFFNNKYAILEYIEGTNLQVNNLPIENFTNIIKNIHSTKLNINKRNFAKTTSIYLKNIPSIYSNNLLFKQAISSSEKLFNLINKFKQEYTVCHNDLNINNFIQTKEKLYVLDFEYTTINDKYFDFATVKLFLDDNNFNMFINKYGIEINKEKLQAYILLINFLSGVWCFMMTVKEGSINYNYIKEGENYFSLMIEQLKNLN